MSVGHADSFASRRQAVEPAQTGLGVSVTPMPDICRPSDRRKDAQADWHRSIRAHVGSIAIGLAGSATAGRTTHTLLDTPALVPLLGSTRDEQANKCLDVIGNTRGSRTVRYSEALQPHRHVHATRPGRSYRRRRYAGRPLLAHEQHAEESTVQLGRSAGGLGVAGTSYSSTFRRGVVGGSGRV